VVVVFYLFKGTNSAKINDKTRQAMAKFLQIIQIIGVVVMITGILARIFMIESFILFDNSVIRGMISIYLGTR
jgi:hypothetical protein